MAVSVKDIRKKSVKPGTAQNIPDSVRSFMNRDISFRGNKVSDRTKERFYSDLSVLLSSGIDIKTALELVVSGLRKKKEKELAARILDKVVAGASFSEVINGTKRFSQYEVFSLQIGEESGRLHEVLKELSAFYNRKIKQRKQIMSAFTYPAMVVITAAGAVIFMLNFIVPMFVDVFKRFNGELPGITKFIIKVSEAVSGNILPFLLFCVLLAITVALIRKKQWYRAISSKLLLKLPVFGSIMNRIYLARFCQAMSLLTGSHTPMLRALQLTRNMIAFYPYEKALEIIDSEIMKGSSLNQSMDRFSIFDKRMVSLVKVAEEVNQLEVVFTRLNKQYSEEIEHQIGVMNSLLEPFMIIFVGIFVAVILVAMYLPLFQVSTAIY